MAEYTNPILQKWKDMPKYKKDDFYYMMRSSMYRFIDPDCEVLEDLEKQWYEYMNIHKDYRLKSDYIMLEFLGCNNETLYNILKSAFLKDGLYQFEEAKPEDFLDESAAGKVNELNVEGIIQGLNASPNFENLIDAAKEWMDETGFILILPKFNYYSDKDLESIWENYNLMIKRHRLMADWKSLELFKLTPQQIYLYLSSRNLKRDIEDISPDDFYFSEKSFLDKYSTNMVMNESAGDLSEFLSRISVHSTQYEDAIHNGIISAALDLYDDKNNSLNVSINYTDLPAYTPQEMIDMGVFNHTPEENYFSVEGEALLPGDELLEWFNLYSQVFYGMPPTDRYYELNKKRVSKLTEIYAIDRVMGFARRQGILEMGWNPWINYNNPVNRQLADNYINEQIKSNFGESRIIDLCGFRTPEVSDLQINEDSSIGSLLYPIYLVFEEGTNALSEVIKKVTKGIYSHAAIAFDPSMRKIYSYGVEGSVNGVKGGLVIEDIKTKNPNKRMGIYTIFVNSDIYERIKGNVEWFASHAKETAYSYANLISICFKIPIERSKELICSQFVDRMLKLGGIDLTTKKSSLVDPNYLYRSSKAKKNIYKVFEGLNKSFNPRLVANRVSNLLSSNKAAPIATTECVEWDTSYYHSYLEALSEMYSRTDKNPTLRRIYDTIYMPCMEVAETSFASIDRDLRLFIDRNYVDEAYAIIREIELHPDEDMSFSIRVLKELYYKVIQAKTRYNISNERYESYYNCLKCIRGIIGE